MSGLTPTNRVWRCLISVSAGEDENMKMIRTIFVLGKTFFPAELNLYRIPKMNNTLPALQAWWVNPHQGRQTWACLQGTISALSVAYELYGK
jgi:hypothetical protein